MGKSSVPDLGTLLSLKFRSGLQNDIPISKAPCKMRNPVSKGRSNQSLPFGGKGTCSSQEVRRHRGKPGPVSSHDPTGRVHTPHGDSGTVILSAVAGSFGFRRGIAKTGKSSFLKANTTPYFQDSQVYLSYDGLSCVFRNEVLNHEYDCVGRYYQEVR